MRIFDAHCDTIEKLLDNNASLFKNDYHCDIERMGKYDSYDQFFAVCVMPEYMGHDAFLRANAMIDRFHEEVSLNERYIKICKSYDDITKADKNNKIASLITLEGASPLAGNIENLDYFYNKGVRLITLTWDHRNELGCGANSEDLYIKGERGLSEFGIEVVKRMNEKGIIVDVSHLSEEGFYDVLEYSSKPFMASHSNARSVCPHKRNLTDDMIRNIAGVNGFIGVNLYPPFISQDSIANIDKLMLHIEHIASLTGINCIGLGCDFDGIDSTPNDIKDIMGIYKIVDRLIQLNYSTEFIENFTHKNLMDFIKRTM